MKLYAVKPTPSYAPPSLNASVWASFASDHEAPDRVNLRVIENDIAKSPSLLFIHSKKVNEINDLRDSTDKKKDSNGVL